jgi:hypothetical protein
MTPQIRQWIYTASAALSAIIPLLVAYNVIETSTAGAWLNVIGVLGAIGSGGAATAAVVLARQRKEGTLDFTGSAAEQAIAAIQATVDQAAHAVTDLDKVKTAVTEVVGQVAQVVNVVPGSLVDQLLDAVTPDP